MPYVYDRAVRICLLTLSWVVTGGFAHAAPGPAVRTAYLLDTGGLRDTSELYLVGALQGLVNRDAPRLFLSNCEASQDPTAGTKWAAYLHAQKGFNWVTLHSLSEAINTFKNLKDTAQRPLIRGLIKYRASYWDGGQKKTVNNYYQSWIAANYAAQERLLPVTDDILANRTNLLSGADRWQADLTMRGWDPFFCQSTQGANGLSITGSEAAGRDAEAGSFCRKWVYLDVNATPKIDITVSDLTPGGQWSLLAATGSTANLFRSKGLVPIAERMTRAGTFTFDLKRSGLFNPGSGRAGLDICALTPATTVTVKSIRLLDANGNVPATVTFPPPRNEFDGLPVQRDLTDLTKYPQMASEAEASAWSIANQLPQCRRDTLMLAENGYWLLDELDEAIANKTYIYYADLHFYQEASPQLDQILTLLQPTSRIAGAMGHSEDWMILKLSSFGDRQVAPAENFSFWEKVPASNFKLPQERQAKTLEPKFYINFSQASGDVIPQTAALESGQWQDDPARGQLPNTWGLNAALAEMAPALMEYYAETATPLDSFWAGPSGAGYTQPDAMRPAQLAAFAHITRADLQALGSSPAMDDWGGGSGDEIRRAFTQTVTDQAQPIKLITPLFSGSATNHWMADGTPVIYPARALAGLWDNDGTTTPTSLAEALKATAAAHPEGGPFFLTCNIRFSPTFYQQTMRQLDPRQFQLVGMPDFIALARAAGGFLVEPASSGVSAGGAFEVDIVLHNPDGLTGQAGTVKWALPPGWTATTTQWTHGVLTRGQTLRHTITFTAPPKVPVVAADQIIFSDSRVLWKRTVPVTVYPGGHALADGDKLGGWTASDGASLSAANGLLKILPASVRTRGQAETLRFTQHRALPDNGSVNLNLGPVNLDRKPVLAINIPDQFSNNTQVWLASSANTHEQQLLSINVGGIYSLNLAALTRWKDTQNLTLRLKPCTDFGTYIYLKDVRLLYSVADDAT